MDKENRIYDLLEKLHLEMQDMKSEMQNMKSVMATKDDIANMATKDDIANMATKDDIANMATKDDIANMATKDDIAKLATKEDLNLLGKELHMEIQSVYNEVKKLRSDLSKTELLTAQNTYDIAKLKLIKYDEL